METQHPTPFWRKDSGIKLDDDDDDDHHHPHETKTTGFFSLPAEIRTHIYELVFDASETYAAAFSPKSTSKNPDPQQHVLQDDYWASERLQPLLTSRSFHREAHLLAFSRTTFVVRNPYTALEVGRRLRERLRAAQIASLRRIAVVCEARHFGQTRRWGGTAFGAGRELRLAELTLVLHRSSYRHYLFDSNAALCALLRGLEGARAVVFVRNAAHVKPHFHTWFNRFVSLVLLTDRRCRFGEGAAGPTGLERSWWEWSFDAAKQVAVFERRDPRPAMGVLEYEEEMRARYDWLRTSIKAEEFDHDPMSRNGF